MTAAFGSEPVLCDAADITWCRRPRLYWVDWELTETAETFREPGAPDRWRLVGEQPFDEVVQAGWHKVVPEQPFPTFTTARPSKVPGRKPAGIQQCSDSDLARWAEDSHRFPPYQYAERNCVKNRSGHLRLPNIAGRELMLGFPCGLLPQLCCKSKSQYRASPGLSPHPPR